MGHHDDAESDGEELAYERSEDVITAGDDHPFEASDEVLDVAPLEQGQVGTVFARAGHHRDTRPRPACSERRHPGSAEYDVVLGANGHRTAVAMEGLGDVGVGGKRNTAEVLDVDQMHGATLGLEMSLQRGAIMAGPDRTAGRGRSGG